MTAMAISVDADIASMSCRAAQRLAALAGEACAARGAFHLVLSGGTTPRSLYQTLSAPEFRSTIDWARVHVYFGDERAVPPEHPDSNYGMAKAALLDHVPIPPAQIHRIDVAFASVRQDAAHYAKTLASNAPHDAQGVPQFDLILLGMGPDGHTASLFPGYPAVEETERWVIEVPKAHVEPFVPRVTLTLPALGSCREMLIEASGAGKRPILTRVFAGEDLPANRVHSAGETIWLVDAAALPENFRER